MQLTLPERNKPEGRLVLERGQLAGQGYRVEPEVCDNPVCACTEFTLHCFPETAAATAGSQAPLSLVLDLERRVLVKPGVAEPSPAATLAKAVMEEMTAEQWGHLWNYFYTLKILYTEQANLDELDAGLPSCGAKARGHLVRGVGASGGLKL